IVATKSETLTPPGPPANPLPGAAADPHRSYVAETPPPPPPTPPHNSGAWSPAITSVVPPVSRVVETSAFKTTALATTGDKVADTRAEVAALEQESINIAQALIRDYPDRTDPVGLLGMVYSRCEKTSLAIECWQKALQRNPTRVDLYDAIAAVQLR